MNVLLINPPRINEIIGNNPVLIEEERGHNPPLGLLYIASYLEKNSKHDVQILDCQVEKLSYKDVGDRIAISKPDVVGITTMTLCLLDVIEAAKIVKERCPEAAVVLGGPHVNLFPEETINFKNIDYLVLGEGEITFCKLLENIDNHTELREIRGLVFKSNGKIINTGMPSFIEDLNILPNPARHLVPYKKYTSLLSPYNPITTIITSRGCPYTCTFCDRPHLGRRFRARSAENVVEEIIECKKMGIKYFLLYDDTFTVDKKRVIDICNLLIKNNIKTNWEIRTRIDTVNKEMLKKLKKAGCTGIHYGVESGSEKILKVLDKRISLNSAKDIFKETHKAGIKTLAYFMIGSPTETIEDINATFKFAKSLNPDYIHMTILTPFPGTRIYQMALEQGIIKKDVWREFAKNPTLDFIPPVWNEIFSRDELAKILAQGYREFYIRPIYILNKFIQIRTFLQFMKFVRVGVKVFKMKGR